MGLDLTPGSPEWVRRASPSKAAAIMGVSPWDSPRAMWHKMRGDIPGDPETPAMERGTLCEPAVLAWWRKHHDHDGWSEQVSMTLGDWCVATPDAIAETPIGTVLVEAKTTGAYMDDWGAEGTDEIPLYYMPQVFMSMEVAKRNGHDVQGCYVVVLGGFRNLFTPYWVPYSAEMGALVLDRCREFYDSLDAGTPPPLDGMPATYEAVRRVHEGIDRDASVELDETTAWDLIGRNLASKTAADDLRAAKAVVLDLMGEARTATFNGHTIARRQSNGFVVTGKPEHLETA